MEKSLRHYENLHIPLWLMKDACWMMEWKTMGIMMIIPTVYVAVLLAIRTGRAGDEEFWINLAICLWIMANAYWMICEFIGMAHWKNMAGWAFAGGLLSAGIYYWRRIQQGKSLI